MKAHELEVVRSRDQASRNLVLGLLFLSAAFFLFAAILFGTLGATEEDKLITAACVLFAGAAFALGLAFRSVGAPTWKHKLAVAFFALPAALLIIF